MKSVRKKIMTAGFAVMILLVTAVSTTYAWFSLNDSAWVDGFDIGIENTDHLLISTDGVNFKQSLNRDDVIEAINSLRGENYKINDLNDIRLNAVTSLDGIYFSEQIITFQAPYNKQELSYVEAALNHYVQMKLYFTVEENGTVDGALIHQNYSLNFKTKRTPEVSQILETSFTAEDQMILTKNGLINLSGPQLAGTQILVNPTNALRLSVQNKDETNIDYIYDAPANENDLGSYALNKSILDELDVDYGDSHYSLNKYDCNKNAMYTYYNNIQNDILKPMGISLTTDIDEKEKIKDLLDSVKNDYEDPIGNFVYNPTEKKYNVVEITLSFWIEGFDADNLIGLNTTNIRALLSFEVRE